MTPYIDVIIQKGTDVNRQYLVDRVKDSELRKDISVVYIYLLVDENVNYPNKRGQTIYIGEAGRPSEPTGKRFGQHISTEEAKGGDTGTIYSLSRYYWLGKPIQLKVFLIPDRDERKLVERRLLNAHVKEFGSLPICQGTTGSNYGTKLLSELSVSETDLALFHAATNNSLNHAKKLLGLAWSLGYIWKK